jgi:hypothetical protein
MDGTTAAAADRGDGNIVGRQPLFIKTLFYYHLCDLVSWRE